MRWKPSAGFSDLKVHRYSYLRRFWDRLVAPSLLTAMPLLALGAIAIFVLIALLLVVYAELSDASDSLTHAEAIGVLLIVLLLTGVVAGIVRQLIIRNRNSAPVSQTLQLIQEKQVAESASAAKSRYLASVSHEIRSPLNSIYGYAQLMERGCEISPVDAARVIRRSAEHLTNLVEGLLDISQVENGVLRVSNDVVRFAPFLDQIANMFRHTATSKGLRLVYDRPEILPEFVRMDQKRLRQVLINLLSNAMKFTSEGSVCFRITYAGQMASFEVSDTGPGIAPEDQERIFAPFERGADSVTYDKPGVGLGLSITRALVQIMGGEVLLDSEVGRGTRFRVRLMLGQVAGQVREKAPTARIGGYEGRQRSILVVDDDVQHLTLMRELLEGIGFDVAVAPGGEAALALSAAGTFDLAVLDITMPGISGWETAGRLRQAHGPALRIIMLSANAHEKTGSAVGSPIHDLFLVKPVELGALVEAIGEQLGLRWTRMPSMQDGDEAAGRVEPIGVDEAARPHIEKIRELLHIGYVRGIEQEIKALAATGPEAKALSTRLFDYLDRFDLTGMNAVLEPYS